jgi:pimeloyl-ACP methyl ester carboxylesterase
MFQSFMTRLRRRRLAFACMAALVIGVPASCGVLQHTERKLLFRIEPGTAGWYHGLPGSVQELDLQPKSFKAGQNIHAWWWPAEKANAPAILYLHGVRWNLTGQLFRIEQLRAAGYSVLAIDYRGFGQSKGDLPSESSVYEDARVAWERFKLLQPDPAKRLIYGHSLGGAVAIDLAAELGQTAARDQFGAASARASDRIYFHHAGRCRCLRGQHVTAGALAAVAEIRFDRQDRRHSYATAGGARSG